MLPPPPDKQSPIRVTDHSYDHLEDLAKQHLPNMVTPLLEDNFPNRKIVPFEGSKGKLGYTCSNSITYHPEYS